MAELVTNNGQDYSNLKVLTGTNEYAKLLPTPSDDIDANYQKIITGVYQRMFDRDPDPEGLNYFMGQMLTRTVDITTIALNVMDGAKGADLATLQAKTKAADMFTTRLDTSVEVMAYAGDWATKFGRDFIDNVQTGEPEAPTFGTYVDQQVALLVSNTVDTIM